MDQLMGTIDPILEIECAGIVANTQKIENNQNPVWNKELYVKCFYIQKIFKNIFGIDASCIANCSQMVNNKVMGLRLRQG